MWVCVHNSFREFRYKINPAYLRISTENSHTFSGQSGFNRGKFGNTWMFISCFYWTQPRNCSLAQNEEVDSTSTLFTCINIFDTVILEGLEKCGASDVISAEIWSGMNKILVADTEFFWQHFMKCLKFFLFNHDCIKERGAKLRPNTPSPPINPLIKQAYA